MLGSYGLSRSRSVPFLWIVHPKIFLEETPNTYFKGFILKLYCLYCKRTFLNHLHVSYIIFEALMEHIEENSSHIALISGACNLKAKRDDRLVEVAHGSLESSLFTFISFNLDLVVAIKFVHEEKHQTRSS